MGKLEETAPPESGFVPAAQGQQPAGHGQGLGHMHTAIMETIREDLERQHPDLFTEDSDGEVVIPSGRTPQSAYVKLDISALAEVALAAVKNGADQTDIELAQEAWKRGKAVWARLEPTEALRLALDASEELGAAEVFCTVETARAILRATGEPR